MPHAVALGQDRKSLGRARLTLGLVAGVILPFVCSADGQRPGLTIEQRVAAQRAIEQVYWDHRVWPKDNPGQKPGLSTVLPDAAVRARVEDSLRKTNALRKYWHQAITPAQLQAEMNRMAERTQDARMLRELFTALGNDPRIIAETLARDTLADRLLRSWYAGDVRVHGDLSRKAAAAAACPGVGCMRSLGGEYRETTWRLRAARERTTVRAGRQDDVDLDPEDWDALLARLTRALGGDTDSLPVLEPGGVEETPEAFVVTAVLSQEKDAIRTATVTWTKAAFGDWWERERATLDNRIDEIPFSFMLPVLDLAACTPDTWTRSSANVPPSGRRFATAAWTGTEMIVWGGLSVFTSGSPLNTGGRYNPSTDTWTPTPFGQMVNVPGARYSHTAVWTGTQMIVWGGQGSPTATNTGGRYDPSSDTWTATSTGANVPSARSSHTAVWTGTQMIVWGGNFDRTGGRYDPSTDSWTPTSTGANVPTARSNQTAVWTGARMIVWGGTNDSSGGRYNPSNDTWNPTSIGANVPAPRRYHTAVWTGTEMVVWGGLSAIQSNTSLDTGGRYDPSSDTWAETSTGTNLPEGRSYHTAAWTGTEMIVWGGGHNDGSVLRALNTGGRYNPSTNAWTPTSTAIPNPAPRILQVAAWTGTWMIVWGGGDSTDLATGGRYDPSTDSWTPTSTGSFMPSPRRFNTTVWTGAEMIVWGGSNSQPGYLNTGGRYDPSTDTWRATSTGTNVPEGRAGHNGLWTGTKMIVWGGASSLPLNTGGRYDPSTDTWQPTSTGANVPMPRLGVSAVWTGTAMIVWGGIDLHCELICNGDCCYEMFNSGARYNPSTDSWTPTSIGANVPSPRWAHSAVWTGTQMIVWGGDDGSGFLSLNTGGRYDPSTDTWTPTSAGASAPRTREGHDAVWTGTQMLVWGGSDLSVPNGFDPHLTSGGRYDPSTDTWTPTSLSNVPRWRSAHGAVWTGTSLIVWAGVPAEGGFLNSGGQYFPTTDTWMPTSTGTNVPHPRASPAVAWDGTGMIAWGGLVASIGEAYSPTGGRYCPCVGGNVFYRDSDGDGHGDPVVVTTSCDGTSPAGYVALAGDCNDANASVHPGATELCNVVDDDCDGTIDDVAPPGPVGIVVMRGDVSAVEWQPLGSADTYDVVYGDLGSLAPSGGDFALSTRGCIADGITQTGVLVDVTPARGNGIWLLVRGSNCGGNGNYDEAGQTGSRDVGIAASPLACP